MSAYDRIIGQHRANGHAVQNGVSIAGDVEPWRGENGETLQDVGMHGYLDAIEMSRKLPKIERLTGRQLVQRYPKLRDPLIGHLLRVAQTMNLVGGSKSQKSWLLHSLLVATVVGSMWLGRFQIARGKFLLIDNELQREDLSHRLQAVAEAMHVRYEDIADLFEIWALRGNRRNLFEIREDIRATAGQFALIGIDALYRMLPDGASENDNAQVSALYNELDSIAETTGAGIVVVHHSGKGSHADKRTTDVGAGAGAQSRAVDCHLVLREHEDPNAVVMDAAIRSFAPLDPVVLRWGFPLWQIDETADPSRLKGRTRIDENLSVRDAESDAMVLRLTTDWQTREDLKRECGWGYTRLDRCLRRMQDDGRLEWRTETIGGKEVRSFKRGGK